MQNDLSGISQTFLIAACVAVSGLAGCSKPSGTAAVGPTAVSDDEAVKAAEEASFSAVPVDREGFRPLALRDFDTVAAQPDTWREDQGLIITTGKPKGYIYTRHRFGNLTWRGEFRFVPTDDQANADQSNTGFMLCIHEPHKVWPRSLEVQGKFIEMGQIKANGGVPALTINDDQASRESARKPVGEWNSIEITVRDGAVSSMLNGKAICFSEPGELKDGHIGLQAENFPVEFRGLRVRED